MMHWWRWVGDYKLVALYECGSGGYEKADEAGFAAVGGREDGRLSNELVECKQKLAFGRY
jgi:hypothetical protein